MKANELRIGNLYYFFNGTNNILSEVESVNSCQIDGIVDTDSRIKPVPLTEEWLLKFGFTENDINGDSIKFQKLPFELVSGNDGIYYDYKLKVEYVHQLQNLVHALTGQELILKP